MMNHHYNHSNKCRHLIFALALVLGSLSVSLGLDCYQCDSSKDEYCPETWDRTDIEPTTCDHLDYPAFCAKTTGIYGAIVGTRRFCSSRHMDNSCNEVNFAQDPRVYYSCIYTCTTDGCNAAVRLGGAPADTTAWRTTLLSVTLAALGVAALVRRRDQI